jgi:class I fructose-bisphosphate aldolase
MKITTKVKKILENYSSESPAILSKLYSILMNGKLAGSGKMVILPVDQGFEHGPDRSFAKNPDSYDPDYHYRLAIDAGLSAYAAPLGFISTAASKFAGQIPTILKMNSSNSLFPKSESPDQSITASVKDAVELGCTAIGLTIYPGSRKSLDMIEEARELIREAKSYGIMSVIWSYPRGEDLTKEAETAIDVCAYAAHVAALIGAHIIKVKPPTEHIAQLDAKKVFDSEKIDIGTLERRIAHVVQSCFAGKRLVVFSGGVSKDKKSLLDEISSINSGGGSGSIIGRNSFQRPRDEALALLDEIVKIYKS